MRSIDFDRRRIEGLRARALAKRTSVQIVVGALAIAAVVLAFLLRPGQSSTDAKPTAAPVKATATIGAVVPAPAPTVATLPTTQPREQTYTVAPGDTLSSIATKYYGDASKYQKIFEANKDILKTPDSLQVGQKLRIPE